MGEHDENWHVPGLTQLKASFADYEALKNRNFDDVFKSIPVVYDDILQRTRKRANEDFAAFKAIVLADVGTDDDVISAVGKELDKYGDLVGVDNGFAWTHILDVILYRFSNTIRMGIDVSVAEQITRSLSQNNHVTWSVLAHSLGTSVAHNSLNSLHNTGFPHAPNGPIEPLGSTRIAMQHIGDDRECKQSAATRRCEGLPDAGEARVSISRQALLVFT